ncbi:MAG TPA: hypothetical protein VJA85_06110 [Candidatus Limnocylindria bacterium]|nr:hypothetical protein [Candidatus Limnocylindria bacterium]
MASIIPGRMARPLVLVAALAALALSLALVARPAAAGEDHKVTICHRTASDTNPYVKITVDIDAADGDLGNDNGQGDHYMEHVGPVWYEGAKDAHVEWGDIIPPIEGVHDGLNWTDEGQAIYENDCNPVAASPSPTPEESVLESATPEGSQAGGTGTPEASVGDGAVGFGGVSPIPTVVFSLILLASLGALAYANVRSARLS